MNDLQLTIREFYLYIVIAGAILGALFGLVPLLLGRRRGKGRLGWYGFIASIVTGAIAPLLAMIVTAIFAALILREDRSEPASGPDVNDENGSASE